MYRYLGIDIGGTSIKHALISNTGEISQHGKVEIRTDMTKSEIMQILYRLIDETLTSGLLDGIGISSMGIIEPGSGKVLSGTPNLPSLAGLPVVSLLKERFPNLYFHLLNDIQAMTLGEQWMGAAKNCSNFFCIALGAGVGGCAVMNGQICRGAHFHAGEIGYLNYVSDGDFLEKHISTKSVMNAAAAALGRDSMDGFEFFELVRQKNKICEDILGKWIRQLSRLIANIIIVYDPEKVILGGGISQEAAVILPQIQDVVRGMLPKEFHNQTEICAAFCGNAAALLGAVSPFVNR